MPQRSASGARRLADAHAAGARPRRRRHRREVGTGRHAGRRPAITSCSAGRRRAATAAPASTGRAVLCDRLDRTTYRNRLPSGAARLHARGTGSKPFLGTACFATTPSSPKAASSRHGGDEALPFDALATLGCAVVTESAPCSRPRKVPRARRGSHRRRRRRAERRPGRGDRRARADHRDRSAGGARSRSRAPSAQPMFSWPRPMSAEAVRELTGGRGVDFVFDTVGTPATLADSLAAAEGRHGRAHRPVAHRCGGKSPDVSVRDAGKEADRIAYGPAGRPRTSCGSSNSTGRGS